MTPSRRRPPPTPGTAPEPPAAPVGWDDVVAQSDALAAAETDVEPVRGDLLHHPTLGLLEVTDVADGRVEVRDRDRRRRKLARAALQIRLAGDRHGQRLLKVRVRGD